MQDVYIILLGSECSPDWLCYVHYKLEHVLFPDWDWTEPLFLKAEGKHREKATFLVPMRSLSEWIEGAPDQLFGVAGKGIWTGEDLRRAWKEKRVIDLSFKPDPAFEVFRFWRGKYLDLKERMRCMLKQALRKLEQEN